MRNRFDWQFHEQHPPPEGSSRRGQRFGRFFREALWFWVIALALTGSLVGIWYAGRQQLEERDEALRTEIQDFLDLQQRAVLSGDGELFFSTQAADSAWRAAQLQPAQLAAYRAGFTVTSATAHDEFVRASAGWETGGDRLQRLLFFERSVRGLRQVPEDPRFWGDRYSKQYAWGTLVYRQADETWADEIGSFVDDYVETNCGGVCIQNRLPFAVDVRADFAATAAPGSVFVSSPRLAGLDEAGEIPDQFWQTLRQQLEDYLLPITIRFAIPPPRSLPCCQTLDYVAAAAAFERMHPHIRVQLIELDELPEDLDELTAEFDGAAVRPTAGLVAAGKVVDLSAYAESDPAFQSGDFYEQVWQGAHWLERMWFMPLTAEVKLLYHDRALFRAAALDEPSLFWTWAALANDAAALRQVGADMSFQWAFLDTGQDSLFAHAFSLANTCPPAARPPCMVPLSPAQLTPTLDWFAEQLAQGHMPDLTALTPEQRELAIYTYQSARRHAAVWIDTAAAYEAHQLVAPVGINPLPGADGAVGITPLWVDGAFVSAASDHPRAVWEWLSFLSFQAPLSRYRLIPARPSAATHSAFWATLPPALAEPMRVAFTFSRPVTLAEEEIFSWSRLAAVAGGQQNAVEAAQEAPELRWFRP